MMYELSCNANFWTIFVDEIMKTKKLEDASLLCQYLKYLNCTTFSDI